ncbi:MAG: DUF4347 domain-containing protein [Saprospiraceae bacterium]|nr:DUF4347 domain-containing protein [Saprospiraceae bacterium]
MKPKKYSSIIKCFVLCATLLSSRAFLFYAPSEFQGKTIWAKQNIGAQFGLYIDPSVQSPTAFIDAWSNLQGNDQGFHLVSHGRPGELLIEGHWLGGQALATYIKKRIGTASCYLSIYGCEFGKGEKGHAAVEYLAQSLGIPVAASDDMTGNGGDWVLEVGHQQPTLDLPEYANSLQCPNIGMAPNQDFDCDGIINSNDWDDDNDGISDYVESNCPSGLSTSAAFTSLGQARSVVTPGVHFFNIGGEAFSAYVNAQGQVRIAIDYGNGTGNLPQVTSINTTRGILTPAILSKLTSANLIRITHSGNGIDVTSTNATLISKIINNQPLHLGLADNLANDSWTGTSASRITGDASCNASAASLNQTVLTTCGNSSGFNWVPSTGMQRINFSNSDIPNAESFSLWLQAAPVACPFTDSDNDGISDSFDKDSDNDGCLDAIEGASAFSAANLDANNELSGAVDVNGMPTLAGQGGQDIGSSQSASIKDPNCATLDICGNGKDDDNDGLVDNNDTDCCNEVGFTLNSFTPQWGLTGSNLVVRFNKNTEVLSFTMTLTGSSPTDPLFPNSSNPSNAHFYLVLTRGEDPTPGTALDVYPKFDISNTMIVGSAYYPPTQGNYSENFPGMTITASGNSQTYSFSIDITTLLDGIGNTNGIMAAQHGTWLFAPKYYPTNNFTIFDTYNEATICFGEVCTNGIDDDGDGLADCADSDCGKPSVLTAAVTNPTNCPVLNNGTLVVVAEGPNLEYSRNNGISYQSSKNFTGLSAGTNNVVVRNSLTGCTTALASNPLTVVNPVCVETCGNGIDDDNNGLMDCSDPQCSNGLSVNAGADQAACPYTNSTVTAAAANGFAPYSYTWSHGLGAGATKTVAPPMTTNYTVTVTSTNGCTATDQVTINVANNATCPAGCFKILVGNYNTANGHLNQFDLNGNFISNLNSFGNSSYVSEVIASPDGQVLVSFNSNYRIDKYNAATGAFISNVVPPGANGLENIWQMAIGPDGMLYIATNTSVLRYNPNTGAFLGTVGLPGLISGVGFDELGNMYVSKISSSPGNNKIEKYNSNFVFQNNIFVSTDFPSTLTMGPDGNMYFGVESGPTFTIYRYDITSGAVSAFCTLDPGSSIAGSFGWAPDGRLWVPDWNEGEIHIISNTGVVVQTITNPNMGQPCGLLVMPCIAADYGDLPAIYPTSIEQFGPQHLMSTGLMLGTKRDADGNGQPSPLANFDDNDIDGDDEDGVLVPAMLPGTIANFIIISSGTGKLNSFFDWNADGDFNDPSETQPQANVVAGYNSLLVQVPSNWNVTTTFGARFRLSTAGGLSFVGGASDGEVEDYIIGGISEVCANGIDDDGDGLLDCADPQCQAVGMPTLANDAYSTCPQVPFDGIVSINDGNLQSPAYSIVTQPTKGTVSMNSLGMFNYSPTVAGCATDQFVYKVCNLATGCCSNATANIGIGDTQPPVLLNVPADITIACDDEIPVAPLIVAQDACPGISVTMNEADNQATMGACKNYTITRTWTATDLCGNSVSDNQLINVYDNVKPELFRLYTLANGKQMAAGIAQNTTQLWKYVKFPSTFATVPLVFTTVTTSGDAAAVSTQVRNVTTSGFEVRLMEEEAADKLHLVEKLSWLAIEKGDIGAGNGQMTAGLLNSLTHTEQVLNYPVAFPASPVFFAAAQTTNEADAFVIRTKAETTNNIRLYVQEETSGDAEVNHLGEKLGYLALKAGENLLDEESLFVGEPGKIAVNQTWKKVTLTHNYSKPVVIISGLASAAADPATVRVRNVTSNSFEVRVQEWNYLDGSHANETVNFIVVEGSIPNDPAFYCFNEPNLPQPGLNLFAIDNCDDQASFGYNEAAQMSGDGLVTTRTWTATDDCGNVFLQVRTDTCDVAALYLKAILAGATYGQPAAGSEMRSDLLVKQMVPLMEPYTNMGGFIHKGKGGGEIASQSLFDVTLPSQAVVDWVFLEIRSAVDPTTVLATCSVLLHGDGSITTATGESVIAFPSLPAGQYYVAVRHRNHLGVMTSTPWALSIKAPPLVDFTATNTSLYGGTSSSHILPNSKQSLWAGDLNGDRRAIYQGPNNDVFKLFSAVLGSEDNTDALANFILPGYSRADFNLDGNAIYQGPNNDRSMLLVHTILKHPSNSYYLANLIVMEMIP